MTIKLVNRQTIEYLHERGKRMSQSEKTKSPFLLTYYEPRSEDKKYRGKPGIVEFDLGHTKKRLTLEAYDTLTSFILNNMDGDLIMRAKATRDRGEIWAYKKDFKSCHTFIEELIHDTKNLVT